MTQSKTFPLCEFIEEAAQGCIAQNAEEFDPRIFGQALLDVKTASAQRNPARSAAGI